MAGTAHIVGAGLAGLAAAVRLADAGMRVALYEAAPQAGGRCRSYFDSELGCRLDNGNHLLLTANKAAMAYLATIGASATLTGPGVPRFDWCDLASGEFWTLAPGMGRFPWWLLDRRRRVPGTHLRDYLAIAGLRKASSAATIADCLDTKNILFRRLWQPFAVAALNTEVEAASAALLWQVLRESFLEGGAALCPLVPREGLSESFVDPALSFFAFRGGVVRFGARLRSLGRPDGRIAALEFDDATISLGEEDVVILAVPAPVATRLLPEIAAPDEFRAILNGHFLWESGPEVPLLTGIVNGTAEWVFRKPGILSVTVSAADRLIDEPAEALAERLWADVTRACRLGDVPLPRWRIVKEKRATFAATPAQLRRRPQAATVWPNLLLAGDWTWTGLPATIEGAIRSGDRAAGLARSYLTKSLTAKDLRPTHTDWPTNGRKDSPIVASR